MTLCEVQKFSYDIFHFTAAQLNFTHTADNCIAVGSLMQDPMPGFLLWASVLTTTLRFI